MTREGYLCPSLLCTGEGRWDVWRGGWRGVCRLTVLVGPACWSQLFVFLQLHLHVAWYYTYFHLSGWRLRHSWGSWAKLVINIQQAACCWGYPEEMLWALYGFWNYSTGSTNVDKLQRVKYRCDTLCGQHLMSQWRFQIYLYCYVFLFYFYSIKP